MTPDWGPLYLTPILHGIFMIITIAETWHDNYTITKPLKLLNSYTHVFLNPCTPVSPILMSPALLLLLIAQLDWHPA